MKKYTHNEFLFEKNAGRIQFSVNYIQNRSEVENMLPPSYRQSEVAAKGVSMMLLIFALPLFLVTSWIWALICTIGALGFFVYTRSFNYRVFVRANVKTSETFYNFCVENNVINIYEINRG